MANVDAMVQQAVAAIKANRKAEGRQILEQALAIDEYNEQAWLWLSGCVETLEEQLTCLENVLTVNPENQKAQKGIAAVRARLGTPGSALPAAPVPAPPDPFANSPFAEAAPPNPYGDAYEPNGWGSPPPEPPRTSTSVEWGPPATPTASARHVGQPSEEEYDQWVANLPIATTNGSNRDKAQGSGVFTEDIFSVASGPFNAPDEETNEPFSFDAASPFDSYNPVDTFKPDAEASGAASFGSFSASLEAPAPAPASEPGPRTYTTDIPNYDDLRFTDEDPDSVAEPDEIETLDAGAFALHAGGWDAGNPFAGGRDVVLGSSAGAMPSSGLFKAIPAEIQVGSPGGKASPALIISTVLLGALNVVALIALLNNLPR